MVDAGGTPGTVLGVQEDLVIACGEQALAVSELQRAGARRLSAAEFLRGSSGRTRRALRAARDALARRGGARRARRGGRSLSAEFERADEGAATPRAALIDLTHGTLRRYGRVAGDRRQLSRRERGDPIAEALLWCSLYALESGRYAEYTVVDQAVRACAALERWSAKGYVNALLRGYLRERASLETRIQADPEARYQHPRWWIELLARLSRGLGSDSCRRQLASADVPARERRRSSVAQYRAARRRRHRGARHRR